MESLRSELLFRMSEVQFEDELFIEQLGQSSIFNSIQIDPSFSVFIPDLECASISLSPIMSSS